MKEISVAQQAVLCVWKLQPARRKHLLLIYGICAGSLQRTRESWSKKCYLVQFSVLGGSERLAEGMGLPGLGFEFLKSFKFSPQCNKVPDERRYLLPLKSNYMRQIDRMVGLI